MVLLGPSSAGFQQVVAAFGYGNNKINYWERGDVFSLNGREKIRNDLEREPMVYHTEGENKHHPEVIFLKNQNLKIMLFQMQPIPL